MKRDFNVGEIVRVELKTALYQIVAEKNDQQVYIRQIFNKDLKFKLGKAELYHRSWLHSVSKNYETKLLTILNENPDIKNKLNDLSFDPAFHYYNWFTTLYYIDNTKLPTIQNKLDDEIEREPTNKKLNELINEFQRKKLIEPINKSILDCKIRRNGESIYRLECGRYESDFDEYDQMSFRCARFYRIKHFENR